MRKTLVSAILLGCAAFGAHAASAQSTPDSGAPDRGATFRGIRIEGNIGGDRFRSQGRHHDKLGYGATVGWDGMIAKRFVFGPEASFWRANDWNEICGPGSAGGTVCQKSFEEWSVGGRVGMLVTPNLLVFGRGAYVTNEQRKRFDAPAGQTGYYDHYNTNGYQVGGGVEYSLGRDVMHMPLYVGAQYVYSQYHDHTSRQRVMGSIGIRFK